MRFHHVPLAAEVRIIHVDGPLIAVDKPAGMLVHNSRYASRTRELALTDVLKGLVGKPVFPLHRLDRQTSGVLLFDTERERVATRMEEVKQDAIKTYLALVRGHLKTPVFVDSPIKNSGGKEGPAKSYIEPMVSSRRERMSLVKVSLARGRFHQVRRHVRRQDHPIVLDREHGDRRFNKGLAKRMPIARLALHAWSLDAVVDGRRRQYLAPLPNDFVEMFATVFEPDDMTEFDFTVPPAPLDDEIRERLRFFPSDIVEVDDDEDADDDDADVHDADENDTDVGPS